MLKNSLSIFLVVSILLVVIFVSGCTNSSTTSHKVFENQFVKFNVPDGITVVDDSTDTDLELTFMKGSDMIGGMSGIGIDPTVYNDLIIKAPDEYYKTTIAGYSAIEGKTKLSIEAWIPTGGKTEENGNLLGIEFDFDIPYTSEFNIVKNSLKIKKTPT